ncbi:MAG: DUF5678 domain-containing protein [bacterium]|nr:DUF5678 domain-containing protein [bacterium]
MKTPRKRLPLFARFENQWVALTRDRRRIVAAGKTVEGVGTQLKRLKRKPQVIFHYVPPFDRLLAP